ncbi:ParB/RepB/Spo0J family partition protein [Agitococcus lubricus]|uniref:Probable chromosome-partitioning protein ParB n=1 Tax=Agitococcus lubricus TaxID=1077255 RepID=A0A2T5IY79_9GAMM|nr:ParB/RepB/Spo0J family partition protein [Agitococcus lubricus]PTQ88941.1 chromosome segregation DNA-binding protein [Agitococcus lubricus]
MSNKKRGLGTGRGLDALLGAVRQVREDVAAVEADSTAPAVINSLQQLPLDQLQRGRYQPRRDMNPTALQELADSIKVQGVMQPIVVRPLAEQRYEIVAGERRWRAAQMAGLETIPAVVRDIQDDTAMAMALIENIQREDLNPMEQATAMHRFVEEFELTHQQIAEAVGKARATVSNLLRLIALPREVKTLLEHGDLEMGHARALLSLPELQQTETARLIVDKGLSVRQTEALVRSLLTAKDKPVEDKRVDANVAQLQQRLSDTLGAAVQIDYNKKGQGRLVIRYNSFEELDGILAHIQ